MQDPNLSIFTQAELDDLDAFLEANHPPLEEEDDDDVMQALHEWAANVDQVSAPPATGPVVWSPYEFMDNMNEDPEAWHFDRDGRLLAAPSGASTAALHYLPQASVPPPPVVDEQLAQWFGQLQYDMKQYEKRTPQICRNYPHCPYGAQCRYFHPDQGTSNPSSISSTASQTLCRNYPNCSFGARCRFRHPKQEDV